MCRLHFFKSVLNPFFVIDVIRCRRLQQPAVSFHSTRPTRQCVQTNGVKLTHRSGLNRFGENMEKMFCGLWSECLGIQELMSVGERETTGFI